MLSTASGLAAWRTGPGSGATWGLGTRGRAWFGSQSPACSLLPPTLYPDPKTCSLDFWASHPWQGAPAAWHPPLLKQAVAEVVGKFRSVCMVWKPGSSLHPQPYAPQPTALNPGASHPWQGAPAEWHPPLPEQAADSTGAGWHLGPTAGAWRPAGTARRGRLRPPAPSQGPCCPGGCGHRLLIGPSPAVHLGLRIPNRISRGWQSAAGHMLGAGVQGPGAPRAYRPAALGASCFSCCGICNASPPPLPLKASLVASVAC